MSETRVTDEMIEDVAEHLFSRGDVLLEFSSDPDNYRCEAKAALEAACPLIRAAIFQELKAAAGEQRVVLDYLNQGYPDTSDNHSEDMGSLTDWLVAHEEEAFDGK